MTMYGQERWVGGRGGFFDFEWREEKGDGGDALENKGGDRNVGESSIVTMDNEHTHEFPR